MAPSAGTSLSTPWTALRGAATWPGARAEGHDSPARYCRAEVPTHSSPFSVHNVVHCAFFSVNVDFFKRCIKTLLILIPEVFGAPLNRVPEVSASLAPPNLALEAPVQDPCLREHDTEGSGGSRVPGTHLNPLGFLQEAGTDGHQGVFRPLVEPVDGRAVDDGRELSCPDTQDGAHGGEAQDHLRAGQRSC